jgi:hypothetical protein
MMRCMLKSFTLALAVVIAVWMLTGTAALAQPACTTGAGAAYPCTIGGTLLVTRSMTA